MTPKKDTADAPGRSGGGRKETGEGKTKLVPAFSLERCKRCEICTHFCPAGAIQTDKDGIPRLVDPEACTSCKLCEQLCPDFAIRMVHDPEEQPAAGRKVPNSDDPGPRDD